MLNWFKSASSAKTLGQLGEEFAQEEYKKRGYKIVAANFFNKRGLRKGEIDFIAKDKKSIIFVEVKTRTSETGRFGTGAEAVNFSKQRKILQAANMYLNEHAKDRTLQPQIDVCMVLADGVDPVKSGEAGLPGAKFNRVDKSRFSATILTNAVEDRS